MRTTIRIDESIYRQAKARAASTGRTVSEVIEDAVRDALRPTPRTSGAVPPLPTYGQLGLQPGIELRSSARLRDAMDAQDRIDALR